MRFLDGFRKVLGKTGVSEHGGTNEESLFFFTLHKCASTLFQNHVLNRLEGLRHVDYASMIWMGQDEGVEPVFEERGHVYGPLRLSVLRASPVWTKVVEPLVTSEDMAKRRAIFFVRDPRDILVSAYHSFGFTHGLSPVAVIRDAQQERRDRIRELGLDGYAVEGAVVLGEALRLLISLRETCARSVLLRYEDLLDDWQTFRSALTDFLPVEEALLTELHERSRPMDVEDPNSHRRSGRVGQYRERLKPATIAAVEGCLADELRALGYLG